MKVLLLGLVSTFALAACNTTPRPETYSVGRAPEILNYDQAKAAIQQKLPPNDDAARLDQPPRVLKAVPPSYPIDAHRAHFEGTVVLDVFIDERGHVFRTAVVGEPYKLLADAAVVAVAQWEFQPHSVDGSPVRVRFRQPITFRMKPPASASAAQQN